MDDEQLTQEEIDAIRALLTADKRRQWLISGVAGVAKWMTVVTAAYLGLKQLVAEAAAWLK